MALPLRALPLLACLGACATARLPAPAPERDPAMGPSLTGRLCTEVGCERLAPRPAPEDAPPPPPPCHRRLPGVLEDFAERRESVVAAVASPRGDRIALLVNESPSPATSIRLLDAATGRERAVIHAAFPNAEAAGMAFSANGRRMAVATNEGTVRVFSARTGRAEAVLPHEFFSALALPASTAPGPSPFRGAWTVAFSPDGRSLASTAQDGTVVVWDLRRRRPRWMLRPTPDQHFTPDGRHVVVSTRRSVTLHDARTGTETAPLPFPEVGLGSESFVIGFDLGADGALLALHTRAADWDWIAFRWMDGRTDHPPPIRVDGSLGPIALGPDHRRVAALSGGGVHVWDVATGRETHRVPTALTEAEGLLFNNGVGFLAGGRALLTVHHASRPLVAWALDAAACPAAGSAKH